jgi:CheY-like chemotaxis protein
MTKEQKKHQGSENPETPDMDFESQINPTEESGEKSGKQIIHPEQTGGNDQPPSNTCFAGPIVTAILTRDNFEMVLIDSSEDAIEIAANIDFHALFIKEKTVIACLDQYSKAIPDIWPEVPAGSGSGLPSQDNSEFFTPLLKRIRSKPPDTKILLTVKKKGSADLYNKARKYVLRLCNQLGLPAEDRELVAAALEIHSLMKLRHPDHSPGGFKSIADAGARSLRLLNEHPFVVGILRSMYCNLERRDCRKPSLELTVANILTVVDLYCDTLHFEVDLTHNRFQTISRELSNLAGKLFLKEVVEAFIAMIEREAPKEGETGKSKRVLIYSDRQDRIYPLETRLRNEGFQPTATESLESFVATCKRRRPDIIIMRQYALPRDVVKTLQHLSSRGINISHTPVFLQVRGIFVDHMAPLLEMGIEDIADLDGSIDLLMVKLKKTRAELDAFPEKGHRAVQPQAGSRGNLSDMNLIDLLQALGPSLRTTRITVKPEEAASDSLLMYLSKGQITFAQLGELKGEKAIHRALEWKSGTWAIEPVTEADLPEPNNDLSNESILLEGCRLMDESGRVQVAN